MLNFRYMTDPYFATRMENLSAIYNKISERPMLTTISNEQSAIIEIRDYQTYCHKYISLVSGWVQNNESIFIDAVKANASQVVEDMLDLGIDVNVRCPKGSTALMWAIDMGDMSLVNQLIEKKADVNARFILEGREEITPLFFAVEASKNPFDFVCCLFSAGATLPTNGVTGQIIKERLEGYITQELSNNTAMSDKLDLLTNQIIVLCQLLKGTDTFSQMQEMVEQINVWGQLNVQSRTQFYAEYKKEYERLRDTYFNGPAASLNQPIEPVDRTEDDMDIVEADENEEQRRCRLYKRSYSMMK